jgi:GxxExxY protein
LFALRDPQIPQISQIGNPMDGAETLDKKDPRTYAIIGAAMEVHRHLGCGFREPVYQAALALEFERQGIPFEPQALVKVFYKGAELGAPHRVDFICYGEILVEIKALARLSGVEQSQVLHYLKATGIRLALLIKFGKPSLEFDRIVLQSAKSAKSGDRPGEPGAE